MAEAKGLNKPVKLKNELAEFLGATELPRTEITKNYGTILKRINFRQRLKMESLRTQASSLWLMLNCSPIFKNTKSQSKSGKVTDLSNLKEGQTINMMQMAAIVGANIE